MKKHWIAAAVAVTAAMVAVPYLGTNPESAQAAEADLLQEAEIEEQEHVIDVSQPALPGAKIAVVSKNTKGAFWDRIHQGMEDALQDVNEAYGYTKDKKLTMTFEGAKDEQDIETQINTLDAVVAENPSVLCMSASDMDSCQPQLEAARENGIPVVVFDSKVDEMDLVSAFRSSDNYEVGVTAAAKMLEAIGGSGRVVIFSAQSKSSSVMDRIQGFQDTFAKEESAEIVRVVFEDQVEDLAASMQEILAQETDLAGVYCTNYSVTEQYLSLSKEENAPILIGTDGTAAQIEAIRSGAEYGTVSQDPYEMGYETMLAAVDLTKLPGSVLIERQKFVETQWLDAAALEQEELKKYQY